MTAFKFEGDYESLSEPQLNLVQSVLLKQGFKDGTVLVEPVGMKGDNYMANVKRLIYRKSDGTSFNMVAKVAPTDETLRMLVNTYIFFSNEIMMYEAVMPKLNEIQNSAGISANEKVRFPTCYGVVREVPNEFILLEDLKESGYEMLDRFQPLPNDAVQVSLRSLAIYHSLSYALKNTEPDTYKKFTEKLVDTWSLMAGDPAAKTFFEAAEADLKQLVEGEKRKKVLTGSLSGIFARAKYTRNYEMTSKYSVIQQGDCWSNNILFRLEEGNVVENVMIDYQLSKESNPAADLLYFILNCTTHETRMKHFHEWIDYYHEALDDSLANFGLKANRVFPKDQLDADLRRYGKLSTSLGILLASILVREAKDVVDMKDMSGMSAEEMASTTMQHMMSDRLDLSTIMKLKQRLEGVIDSSLELGLISI